MPADDDGAREAHRRDALVQDDRGQAVAITTLDSRTAATEARTPARSASSTRA